MVALPQARWLPKGRVHDVLFDACVFPFVLVPTQVDRAFFAGLQADLPIPTPIIGIAMSVRQELG